ncbi:hypothetical protein [Cryptosporangium minutisporangium]|uniref:Lipoprotein n=1 Tax=Cryptosporangium minutisporangium TaxID=113569 RepID=A0ABP6T0E8_9ACTN
MRRLLLLGLVVLTALVNGCTSGGKDDPGDESNALVRALERISASDTTRQQITFDDTAALTELSDDADPAVGFGGLVLAGSPALSGDLKTVEKTTGLRPRSASFTISAGRTPAVVAVVAGGQNADDVEKTLTASGWKADGDQLVASPDGSVSDGTTLPIHLARVRADGSDVVYAGNGARVSDVGRSGSARADGDTLADDRRVAALADCLGDVVAATFVVGQQQGSPTMVAVGVRRPKTGDDTPRAVTCTAWSTSAAADAYTTDLRDALARGTTASSRRPYAELLKSATVQEIGGDEHVVGWQAETPTSAVLILQMAWRNELPALVA